MIMATLATASPPPVFAATSDQLLAYSMLTDWHPIPAIGNYPLAHAAVASSAGKQWGCFGRTAAQESNNAKLIAQGVGDPLWADAIAGPDGHSGIDFGVTGICHHCANRILIPANVDVSMSPGNEIATPIFGKYGLGISDLVIRIKNAAAEVNKTYPGRVSEEAVSEAVQRVTGGLSEEWQIIRADMERILKPKLEPDYAKYKDDIEHIYLALYHYREVTYSSYEKKRIDKTKYLAKMNAALTESLSSLQEVIGPAFSKLGPAPIPLMAAYVFYELPPQFR
jgi:hypothetical protein